ncbi:unnamed protein product [Trifolium pratense]|uniref:Uncharacterized protein n=1 Tax=Trifolium pratense TaxID=57577 RepID=A0ACB0I7W1_TRIPR|nr:unnamed protein product [Trifolium pratense]
MIILLDDESDAFWCFERLMRRYRGNFRCIGRTLGVEAQCWLKKQKDSLAPERQDEAPLGEKISWTSGLIFGKGEASYYIWNPAIHDIVTFRDPTQHCEDNTDVNFIKRVVAKEGDTVEVISEA